MIKFSVILPCYNEETMVQKSLPQIICALKNIPLDSEIILVDDGSGDKTFEAARKILEGNDGEYKILRHEKNLGKGAAVKTGVNASTGDYILFFDIDLSTSLQALDAFMNMIEEKKYPVIIGSRCLPQSKIIVTQNIFRRILGTLYRKIGIKILGLKVSDIGCGFKCFRQDAAKTLFSIIESSGWSFDAELLLLAHQKGYTIKEIPVKWKNNPKSKLKIFHHGPKILLELLRIRHIIKKKK